MISVLLAGMIAVVFTLGRGRARKAIYPVLCVCAVLSIYAGGDIGRRQIPDPGPPCGHEPHPPAGGPAPARSTTPKPSATNAGTAVRAAESTSNRRAAIATEPRRRPGRTRARSVRCKSRSSVALGTAAQPFRSSHTVIRRAPAIG